MQHLEVSGAVRYIYIVRQLRVNVLWVKDSRLLAESNTKSAWGKQSAFNITAGGTYSYHGFMITF